MQTLNHNRIVCDLGKVQHMTFFYRNQFGDTVHKLPDGPTSRAVPFYENAISYTTGTTEALFGAGETMGAKADRLGFRDIWTPEIKMQLQANHSLTYTGSKAKSIWAAWCERQFNKKGKKK